jgi:hypothetical protein
MSGLPFRFIEGGWRFATSGLSRFRCLRLLLIGRVRPRFVRNDNLRAHCWVSPLRVALELAAILSPPRRRIATACSGV